MQKLIKVGRIGLTGGALLAAGSFGYALGVKSTNGEKWESMFRSLRPWPTSDPLRLQLTRERHSERYHPPAEEPLPLLDNGRLPIPNEDKPISRYTLADAAGKVSPAVVNITVVTEEARLWGSGFLSQSSGTGFIIDEQGYLLTNAHVVQNARSGQNIQITLQDGRNFTGSVTNFDSLSDLAVVKVNADEPLPVAKLGTSTDLRAGEFVVAVGSPLTLKNSVTAGIISNSGRESYEIGMGGFSATPAFIQTDAAINIGNSGGPLVNLDGEVIGINTMKVESVDGISFAIPIDYAKDILTQLTSHGEVRRPYLGVKLLTVTPTLMKMLKRRGRKFPSSFESMQGGPEGGIGVMVHEVLPQSPADKGGLRPGDIIVEINKEKVQSTRQLIDTMTETIGKSVSMKVLRGKDGAPMVVQVTPTTLKGIH
uniref:PDZ domain-containing protein n=1 Tax=Rhodosorus marinus TaxID=101924 RepID=A0A7S0BTD6_9RHOD|mmetsp:Transcript_7716/g.11439  ORF Transcript_7716/g.11439 Transcript_7716/m.11439 type:complete len:425 (+) Transcript_7716:222-1496(+)